MWRTTPRRVCSQNLRTAPRSVAQLSWWRPTNERALNSAAYELLGAGRVDEAVAGFELNTVIFPDSWNVWDSLGEAQGARGDTDSAIGSYQRSLALNPGNSNARAAIEAIGRR